jgi:pre-mRNA-processing factor 19
MSVTTCALSGNPLEDPVVSTKTGHVFERRVIEKHIENTGQCPITGVDLEKKDLLPLKGKSLICEESLY